MTAAAAPLLWLRRLMTALIGVAAALLAYWLQVPLPFLLGPLAMSLVLALAGVPLAGPPSSWLNAVRTILGVAAGASVSPTLMQQLPQTLGSAALVPVFLALAVLLGYPLFRWIAGFNSPTAFFATMPGGFAEMILFGSEKGGNIRALSLVHATRILTIVAVTPIALTFFLDVELSVAPGVPMRAVPPSDLLIMLFCAVAGYAIARRIRLFGAPVLGPMILTAAVSLSGLIENRPPSEALILAQYVIGISIGAHYVGVTLEELRRFVAASVAYSLVLGVLTIAFAEVVYRLGIAGRLDAVLAFAPGGQPEMVMLAILAGADITYVILHHVMRLVIVLAGMPLFVRVLR